MKNFIPYMDLLKKEKKFEKKLDKYWYWFVDFIDDTCKEPKFWYEIRLHTYWKNWWLEIVFDKTWYNLEKLKKDALNFVKTFTY